jgi:hypothetical protein
VVADQVAAFLTLVLQVNLTSVYSPDRSASYFVEDKNTLSKVQSSAGFGSSPFELRDRDQRVRWVIRGRARNPPDLCLGD